MKPLTEFQITLPEWVREFARDLPGRLESDSERMAVAVELARRNVRAGTGGPFGALVVASQIGLPISLGVNRVEPAGCSIAHAEIVALSLAQRRVGHWNLDEADQAPLELVTGCEPCAMCLGAIPWSGVKRVVCGAARAQAEAAGFDEGERAEDWIEALGRREIEVVTGVLATEAAEVLESYRKTGGVIYSPQAGL